MQWWLLSSGEFWHCLHVFSVNTDKLFCYEPYVYVTIFLFESAYYKYCVLVSLMLSALYFWSFLRQYSHCFQIHIAFIHSVSPELSTHSVIRELDTPWMTNPSEKTSGINSNTKKESTFWNNNIIIFLSVWCLFYVFFPTWRFSGTKIKKDPKRASRSNRHRLFSSGSLGTPCSFKATASFFSLI